MRVYYKTENSEISSEEFAKPLNDLAATIHYYMFESLKYKIMWALRSLEEEMDKSEGVIIIESKSWTDKTNIFGKGFDAELGAKINAIAVKTKF